MITTATVIAMFNAATNRRERNRAMAAAARLAPADQLRIVDAAITSHRRLATAHVHNSRNTRIIGLDWGTRTIETCECGAYRTFDVPHGDSPADLNDHQWSPWRRHESEQSA
jgi:hypothetical protein